MADKIIENNQVSMVGVVASEFVKSHEVYGLRKTGGCYAKLLR